LNLVRVLHYGKQSKAVVDACVSRSSQMVDLKLSILPLMHTAIGNPPSPQISRSTSPMPSRIISGGSSDPVMIATAVSSPVARSPGCSLLLPEPVESMGGLSLGERRAYSPMQKVRKSVSAALLLSSAPLDATSMPLLATDQDSAPKRFMNSLERYFSLITFAEYLVLHGFTRIQLLRSQHTIEPTTPNSHAAAVGAAAAIDESHRSRPPTGVTLSQWLESRPEIQHICDKLQHELYIAIDKHKQALAGTSEKQVAQLLEPVQVEPLPSPTATIETPDEAHKQEIAIVIASRRGSVLCRESLLKSDHFPGCHKSSLDISITGAPNYRKVGRESVCVSV
jgi:hypothetical protein